MGSFEVSAAVEPTTVPTTTSPLALVAIIPACVNCSVSVSATSMYSPTLLKQVLPATEATGQCASFLKKKLTDSSSSDVTPASVRMRICRPVFEETDSTFISLNDVWDLAKSIHIQSILEEVANPLCGDLKNYALFEANQTPSLVKGLTPAELFIIMESVINHSRNLKRMKVFKFCKTFFPFVQSHLLPTEQAAHKFIKEVERHRICRPKQTGGVELPLALLVSPRIASSP
jgi:hypothetical protein